MGGSIDGLFHWTRVAKEEALLHLAERRSIDLNYHTLGRNSAAFLKINCYRILRLALNHKRANDDHIHNVSLPELDAEISKIRNDGYAASDRAQAGTEAAQSAVHALQGEINSKLAETVNKLLSQSSAKVVAEALRGQILVVRQASREELKSGNALVVRNATREERHQS